MWLNKNEIANLISTPMLEASGYVVSTHTLKQWEVITLKVVLFLSIDT